MRGPGDKQPAPHRVQPPDVFDKILQETERDIGILFSPGQIKLMQVRLEPARKNDSRSPEPEAEKRRAEAEGQQEPKTKEQMLRELRDFVVEKNKIDVRYWDSEVCWEDSLVAKDTVHDITAVRFEKKEVGEVLKM